MAGAPERLVEPEPVPDARPERESHAARDAFQARLERLPPGHPSSPYESDGSRKPPVPKLADRELPLPDEQPAQAAERTPLPDAARKVEPLTDAEYADHVTLVRDRLRQAHDAGLATDHQYTIDPDHEIWDADREAVHDEIIEDLFKQAAEVPNDRRAIIAGGLPGAGKTTVLGERAGIDRSQYLTINPDEIKGELARRGLVPNIDGLSPMEASDLVHEESSHIAKMLSFRAQGEGKNIIWDITMSSSPSTMGRIQDLRDNGYEHVSGVFVDIPPAVSASRALSRHREDHEKYRAGDCDGGRLVPDEGILSRGDPEWGSANRRIFEFVKPFLDTWVIYDNSIDGGSPILIEAFHAEGNRSDWRG